MHGLGGRDRGRACLVVGTPPPPPPTTTTTRLTDRPPSQHGLVEPVAIPRENVGAPPVLLRDDGQRVAERGEGEDRHEKLDPEDPERVDERARERVVERVAQPESRHGKRAARNALWEEGRSFPAVRHAHTPGQIHKQDAPFGNLLSEDEGAHADAGKPVEVDDRSGSVRFEVAVDVVGSAGRVRHVDDHDIAVELAVGGGLSSG